MVHEAALTLGDIATALTGRSPDRTHGDQVRFSEAVIDSRQAREGSLFVALPGERHDGHEFVGAALAAGARGALVKPLIRQNPPDAVLWEPTADPTLAATGPALITGKPVCIVVDDPLQALQRLAAYRRRQFPTCRVVGITGSIGKTSTKELAAAVLAQAYRTLKSPGNYNNEIGLPLTLLRLDETYRRAVLEMSMYDLGEIALLAEIAQPQVGVVTNVEPIHLERLGTIARIAQAKAELVAALPPDGIAILNGDDPHVRVMRDMTPARRVLLYGRQPENELWADELVSRGLEGIALRFHWHGKTIPAALPLIGTHHVWTALAAAAVGLAEGMSWDQIVAGLAQPELSSRLVIVSGIRQTRLLDDTYNAGPASVLAALEVLALVPERRVAVLGDMLELGAQEEAGHRLVGARVAEVAQRLITVGPRAQLIAAEAIARGMPAAAVHSVGNNQEAIATLTKLLEPGDTVLIKGSRGMKMEEIVAALRRDEP